MNLVMSDGKKEKKLKQLHQDDSEERWKKEKDSLPWI